MDPIKVHAMMSAGDTPAKEIRARQPKAIAPVFKLSLLRLARLIMGTRMTATTTGRMPWKIRSTIGFSLKSVKTEAISSMIRKGAMMQPMLATRLPTTPLIR